ncbi:MAG: hypothetical protein KF764_26940 [Labilithrix sp.]|nr:hypothetical protein [Labilithrix sp.]MBX3225644.1 hypothetical protein [Labilithrix sp.]
MKSASIAIALALLAIACSSTTTTTTTGGPDGGASDAGASDAATSDPTDKEKEEEEEEEEGCGGEKTLPACAQCCATAHPEGAAVYNGALETCACKADNCQEECKDTLCASPPAQPDQACVTCANGLQSACGQDVTTACTASQDCMTFYQCITDSGCAGKPQR